MRVARAARGALTSICVALGACWLLMSSPVVQAQDLARERRMADEILPTILVGEPVWIEAPADRRFLGLYAPGRDANGTSPAVLLVHGVGTHPDHGVIGQLRQLLNELGHTTLSIQMPVQPRDARLEDYYPTVFPDALQRIALATRWMVERGHARPAIVSHAMGSWMVNEYLDARHQEDAHAAWVCMSMTGGYSWTMRRFTMPVMDVYAQNDIAQAVSAAWRRRLALSSAGSRQLRVEGAGADYAGRERTLAQAISVFLKQGQNR
jgi:hypothetical protein